MEESNSSALVIIGIIIAVLAAGGVGLNLTSNSDAKAQTIRLNILPSQKIVTEDGTEYRVGGEIKLPPGERLIATYSSKNCSDGSKKIDEAYTPVFSGIPLCEADCNDDNSENLELLADSVDTCDEYFNRQLNGTDIDESTDESPDEENLEEFPEGYSFGEEVE